MKPSWRSYAESGEANTKVIVKFEYEMIKKSRKTLFLVSKKGGMINKYNS